MTPQLDSSAQILTQMQQSWNQAARVWNPRGLAALYAEDALFYGGRAGHSVGAGAIEGYFSSYDGVLRSAVLTLIEQEIVKINDGSFMAQGLGSFAFVLEDGRATKSVLRTTLVLVKLKGHWKIQLHHFSVTPSVPPLGDA